MWHLLRKSYSILVLWDRVMQILREEDPEGTAQQRAHKFVLLIYFLAFIIYYLLLIDYLALGHTFSGTVRITTN